MTFVAALLATLPAFAGTLTVDVLEVGQGDAILLTSPAGKRVLIDAGPNGSEIVDKLRARGVERIDLAIGTHAHADHIGGMDDVMDAFEVGIYIDQGLEHTTRSYTSVMERVVTKRIPYKKGRAGQSFTLDDDIQIELIGPGTTLLQGTRSDLNSNSIVARVQHGDNCFLFTGDAEEPTEHALLRQGLGQCQVLKVAHHGSSHSTTNTWLAKVQPELALISCGKDNRYKHPAEDTLDRLERSGAKVYRTDEMGPLRVESDQTTLRVVYGPPLARLLAGQDPVPGITRTTGTGRVPAGLGTLPKTETAESRVPTSAKRGGKGKKRGRSAARKPTSTDQPAAAQPPPPLQTPASEVAPKAPATGMAVRTTITKLDLNIATASEFERLPGIGPVKAAAIVQWREVHGPYTSVEDLDRVPGFGPGTVMALRPRVKVVPTEQSTP